jgi:signal transduction histidine kinase
MRERVGLADGTLAIRSGSGEGTVVQASLPRASAGGGQAAIA